MRTRSSLRWVEEEREEDVASGWCEPGRREVLDAGVDWDDMKCLRAIAVLALLLLACLSPVMACMRADAPMSAAELACCRMMKSQCGDMEMPASHGCCHKTLSDVQAAALDARTAVPNPVLLPAARTLAPALMGPRSGSATRLQAVRGSPPKAPPPSISNLRI